MADLVPRINMVNAVYGICYDASECSVDAEDDATRGGSDAQVANHVGS